MAADTLLPPRPQDPPDNLVNRTATVATRVMNTIRVPTDRFQDAKAAWFQSGGMPPIEEGNSVKFMIDASASQFRKTTTDAFHDMVMAIRTASQPGHFIYIASWYCDVDFVVADGFTLRQLMKTASDKGVMIRVMLWKAPSLSSQNNDAILFFNNFKPTLQQGPQPVDKADRLKNSAAIWDERGDERLSKYLPILGPIIPKHVGAQHQKILCVYGEQGLISFCGGIEFNSDRIKPPDPYPTGWWRSARPEADTPGAPLHDLHCRVLGPAAYDVVNVFMQRWNDHPDRQNIENPKHGKPKPPLIVPPKPAAVGDQIVQIGRTFSRSHYGFAPNGETTAGKIIANAIRNAKRYIYTEDQYFVGTPDLEAALLEAIPRIEHFTAVITFWSMTGMPYVQYHRRRFINKLKAAAPDKVRIFSIQPHPKTDKEKSKEFYAGYEPHTYIHTKSWIIDDEFATIGSINSNRRGWSHDNEVCAGIYERSTDQILHYRFAHWLRIEMWKEHLGMLDTPYEAELADGVASAVHWLRRPETARVRPYDLNERNFYGEDDLKAPIFGDLPFIHFHHNIEGIWNEFVDPE